MVTSRPSQCPAVTDLPDSYERILGCRDGCPTDSKSSVRGCSTEMAMLDVAAAVSRVAMGHAPDRNNARHPTKQTIVQIHVKSINRAHSNTTNQGIIVIPGNIRRVGSAR